jgi:hypothetical protein
MPVQTLFDQTDDYVQSTPTWSGSTRRRLQKLDQ